MMKQYAAKYIIGAMAVLILIAAGTFLPGELALGRDRVILGQVWSDPLDAAELSEYVNVSMVDKLSLLAQSTGNISVPLKIGAEYDRETISAKFLEELGKLHEQRFCPSPPEWELMRVNTGVTLYLQNDAPAINMIVWELNVRSEGMSGVFYMDDQTGKILSFSFSGSGSNDLVYTGALARGWASYLGTEFRNIKKGAVPRESAGAVSESIYHFELYSGATGVDAQMSSFIQKGDTKANRWSMSYAQQ